MNDVTQINTNHREEENDNETSVKMHFVGVSKQKKDYRFGQLNQFERFFYFSMANFSREYAILTNWWIIEMNAQLNWQLSWIDWSKNGNISSSSTSHLNWTPVINTCALLINKLYENWLKVVISLWVCNSLLKIGGVFC